MNRVDRIYHVTLFVIALLATTLPFVLAIDADGRVAAGGMRLRGFCLARDVFDTPCPGCGLTRAFVRIAHGDWAAAFEMNRLGFAMFLLLALQVPWRLFLLTAKPKLTPREERLLGVIPRILLVALAMNWIWNATHGWPV